MVKALTPEERKDRMDRVYQRAREGKTVPLDDFLRNRRGGTPCSVHPWCKLSDGHPGTHEPL